MFVSQQNVSCVLRLAGSTWLVPKLTPAGCRSAGVAMRLLYSLLFIKLRLNLILLCL